MPGTRKCHGPASHWPLPGAALIMNPNNFVKDSPLYAQSTYSQQEHLAPQQLAASSSTVRRSTLAQPGQQPYTYQPGQQPVYAPSQNPQCAKAPVQQPRLAYEPQMPQLGQLGLMQHFAQTQQKNWGMGSMNGMGMRDMVTLLLL